MERLRLPVVTVGNQSRRLALGAHRRPRRHGPGGRARPVPRAPRHRLRGHRAELGTARPDTAGPVARPSPSDWPSTAWSALPPGWWSATGPRPARWRRRPRCSRPDAGPLRWWRPRTRWRSACCRRPAGSAWTCPRDVSVVGIDDNALSGVLDLTTVRQDVTRQGRLAGEMLLRLLEGDRRRSGRPDRQLRARGARLHRTPAGLTSRAAGRRQLTGPGSAHDGPAAGGGRTHVCRARLQVQAHVIGALAGKLQPAADRAGADGGARARSPRPSWRPCGTGGRPRRPGPRRG